MTQPSLNSELHRILKHYFEDLGAVMREAGQGEDYARLLDDIGLGEEDFRELTGRLSYENYLSALGRLDKEGRIPGLGLRLGARKRHGTFGLSGFNMLTQGTLGQANRFASDYFEFCWGHFLRLQVAVEGEWAIARYEPSPPSLASHVTLIEQALVTGIRMISEVLPDLDWSSCRGLLAFPAPEHAGLYPQFLPFPCDFDQPFNGWRFPAAWADRSLLLADEDVKQFCELRFKAMLEEEFGRTHLQRQIRRILMDSDLDSPPGVREIARRLELSEQALRASLAREGASFRAILNEVVLERAKQLLQDPRLSIKEIAFQLGYAQPPSFHRAFTKAMGQTPEQFRMQAKDKG